MFPSIAASSTGAVYVTWLDETDGPWGTDQEILEASWSPLDGWTNATCVSDGYDDIYWNNGGSNYGPVAVGPNGFVHVVWEDTTDGFWGTDYEILHCWTKTPDAPNLADIQPDPDGDGKVNLGWDAAPAGQTYNYSVYRHTSEITASNVAAATLLASGISENSYVDAATNGTWWYAVVAANDSGYTISNSESVTVAIILPCTEDAFEENDVRENATDVRSGFKNETAGGVVTFTADNLVLADDDWYNLTGLQAGSGLLVSFNSTVAVAVNLSIVASSGECLATNATTTAAMSLECTTQHAGDVLVLASGSGCVNYSLVIKVIPSTGGLSPAAVVGIVVAVAAGGGVVGYFAWVKWKARR
ncbi:MAG: hypothetical protein ACTSU5_07840 [Promethearchaeota archaeon]